MDSYLETYLENHGIHYKLHSHKAVFSAKESGFLKDIIPGMSTKNLFLKSDNGEFYLVCMNEDKRLDIKALAKHIGHGKLHFGSAEALLQELHITPGSVSIFGMIYAKNTALIVDKDLWNADIVSFHPNINTETLEIRHTDLDIFYNSLSCKKEIFEL